MLIGSERDVGALADLAPGSVRTVRAAGWRICLARRGDELFAIGDECRHRSGSLGHGKLLGDTVACPLHGWRFDLRTGESDQAPGDPVKVYPVRVEDGRVLVTVPVRA